MKIITLASSLACASMLAACGGNGMTASNVPSTSVTSPTTATSAPPAVAAAPTSAPVLQSAALMTPSNGTETGFVNSTGFAIYVFDLDLTVPGTSQCTGVCQQHWPPVAPPASGTIPAPFGTIVRPDGTKQLTFGGRPLYTFASDTNTTQATGDLMNVSGGIWHFAAPQVFTAASTAAVAPSSSPIALATPY